MSPIPFLASLGMVIKEKRNSRNWSQEQLASASGVNRSYLSDIERGQCNPTFLLLVRIATSLNIDLAQIVGEAMNAAPRKDSVE